MGTWRTLASAFGVVTVLLGPVPIAHGATARPQINCDTVGTPDAEAISGTPHGEVICGKGGNDRIWGNGGNDGLYGGTGRDRLSGGPGDDFLGGSDHIDSLQGGAGSDRLDGGNWRDVLRGGSGPDTLDGRDGTHSKDVLRGGPGHDTCYAEANDVTISCEAIPASAMVARRAAPTCRGKPASIVGTPVSYTHLRAHET